MKELFKKLRKRSKKPTKISLENTIPSAFNQVIYYGYSEEALKGYSGSVMPSIGIADSYFCYIHNRMEFLFGTDIDHEIGNVSLRFPHLIAKTKYGYHIIATAHIRFKIIAIILSLYYTLKFHGDLWWWWLGVKRGFFIWRLFGKYTDSPHVRVVKVHGDDPVIKFLSVIYGDDE